MVLASSCCENGFACSTQPRNPQGRLLQVETEKTLANLAIKYELCQKQQLKNYSHELYERMVVILSHEAPEQPCQVTTVQEGLDRQRNFCAGKPGQQTGG